ncbi:MAG TPA: PadR family transcriptional regulator [Caulobacteraceae bacterium]|jgi:DNA-binding PadR family transcriptional regulator|nr:PadR family transcriptional regulator [Caulobacteraceae bacterium]
MHRHSHHHREARSPREFGFHHGRHSHRHFGRSSRTDRIFDQGDLRFVILKLISEAPRHGYELIKAIEERVAGAYSPSPGVIYPTLTLLEELGYVTVESAEGTKKLYRITDAGEAELADKKTVVDAIFARMAELNERFEGPSPRIFRAMQNLGAAISTRMRGGPVDAEQLDALIAAIDEAARKVEKA